MSLVQRWYKTEAALGLPGDGATGRSMARYNIVCAHHQAVFHVRI